MAATVAWRARGILRVTAVVKATFALLPDAPMTLIAPDPIEPDEQEGAPGFGLRAAGDLAPYLGQTDVLLTGHAHAPPGASAVTARFAVVRDEETLIEKALDLEVPPGALPARTTSAPATLRVPLAGMSPLSRHWPVRRRLLQGLDPRTLERPIAEIPEPFDWSYFQAAPLDQRLGAIQGDEWILLGSMHPGLAEFGSRLPGARGAARLYGRAPGLRGRAIPLTEDTLCIDVDRQRCSVLWRGHFPVSNEREFASLHILAGVELPGRALTWVDPFPIPSASPSQPTNVPAPAPSAPFNRPPLPAAPSSPLEGTMALTREDAERLWAAQARSSSTPAAARVPSAPVSKLGPASPPAPLPPPLRPEASNPLEGTVALSDDNPLFGTLALNDADAARLAVAQATPFKPSTTPDAARVPSTPASKLGPSALPAAISAPRSTAPQLWSAASNPLEGTMALSDDDAARLKAGKLTPFEAQGAPIPAPPPPRPSQPASDWTEREVPQAAYVPPARISRPHDEPAVAAFSAAPPLPVPPPPLSAPGSAAGSAAPPQTLGENFLEAMADAGESSA